MVKYACETMPGAMRQTSPGPTLVKGAQLMRSLPETPQRAVIYARVSTDEQERSGYSLRQQLEALRDYCKREGYEVVAEVEDGGQSGASLVRLQNRL
jgi:Resolvase, N terminal domain